MKKYFKKDIAEIVYVKGIIYFYDGSFLTRKDNPEEFKKLID